MRSATTILTDIRNFSGLFEKFQYKESNEFLNFIESYYVIQSDIANIISDNTYMGTTGDGVLTIFLSENNHLEGYAYLLATHRALNKLCNEFTESTGIKASFGIGSDFGNIWEVGNGFLQTYVGTVINRTARIEANTKLFGDTRASIGYYLYNKLIEHFFPASYDIMKSDNYDKLLVDKPEVVLISKEFMLFYIFQMELKNIEKPVPIFRLSESMAENDDIFWRVMSKLLSEDKVNEIRSIL
jgi:hypothetical protein